MTLDDLKRVQEIDLEILSAVDKICREHGIQYYLMYGTLLGAIRHKGPIPWDDDVDICMTRENYLRFYEIAQTELDPHLYNCKVMGSGSLKYLSELKIGKIGTTYCMPGTEGSGVADNVSIDIFCFDAAKHHSPRVHKLFLRIWSILRFIKQNTAEKKLLSICIDGSDHSMKPLYKAALWGTHILRFIFGERFFEWLGYKMFVDPSQKSNVLWDSTMPLLFERQWFAKTIMTDYDSMQFPIPAEYDRILSLNYGNYMEYPPKENRYRKYFDVWVFREN